MIWIYVLFLLIVDGSMIATDYCDKIERNNKFDKLGNLNFTQIIFWEWSEEDAKYNVREWAMDEAEKLRITRQRQGCVVRWRDSGQGVERRVTGRHYAESWSDYDPEREDEKYHPNEARRRFARVIIEKAANE